jgi:glycosyltransferase involved in cell wall biosynthesis
MAAGTPAIVSDRASLPEVVGDVGIVVGPDRTEKIVNEVQRLKEDQQFRRRCVEAGHVRAEKYRWERCVDELVNRCESVI